MLPSEITGIERPDVNLLKYIYQGDVKPISRIKIWRRMNNKEYPYELTNVLGYDSSEDRQFGASRLVLRGANDGGVYSYAIKDSEPNTIYAHTKSDVSVSLSGGTHNNTTYSGGAIKLINPEEMGEWTSDYIFGSTNLYSWSSIRWDIDPGRYVKGGTHFGSVSVYVRFSPVASDDPEVWSIWYHVGTVSSNSVAQLNQRNLSSKFRYAQVRLVLSAAYGVTSPQAKSITLERLNQDGQVYEGQPLFYYGNRITVEEGIVNEDESEIKFFDVFNGYITSVTPSENEDGMFIEVEALDSMHICLGDIIEKPNLTVENDKPFEPDTFYEQNLELLPVPAPGHDDDGDGVYEVPVEDGDENSVFRVPINQYRNNGPIRGYEGTSGPAGDSRGDPKYQPWARRPVPLIYVENDSGQMELKASGYEIDYSRGVVYFAEKQEKSNGSPRKVRATFYWYNLDTNLFEDVVGEIIADAIEKFGYGRPERIERTKDYDIWGYKTDSDLPRPKIILERSLPRTTIPLTTFRLDDQSTHFDAIERIRQHIDPHYYLRATANGNFVGEYLPQKASRDYELALIGELSAPVSSSQIYTRCIARGIEPSVVNLLIDSRARVTHLNYSPNYSEPGRIKSTNIKRIIDSDLTTNVGWQWTSKGEGYYTPDISEVLPVELVKITLPQPTRIGAMNILGGDGIGGYRGTFAGGVGERNIESGMMILVSNNDKDWYPLVDRNPEIRVQSGEWVRLDKSSFSEDILSMSIRYIKFVATSMSSFLYGSAISNERVWNWALRQVQVYPDEEIRVEVSIQDLVESGAIPKAVADDMERRVGTKTLLLPMDTSLYTSDMVKARGLDYLYEMARNLYTLQAETVYAPHAKVGHTVSVTHPSIVESQTGLGAGSRLYYIEGIERSMEGNSPTVTLNLVSWT